MNDKPKKKKKEDEELLKAEKEFLKKNHYQSDTWCLLDH